MNTINFKIDYNSVKMTNPEMGSEVLARKSRYILENKLVFNDPVILRVGLYARLSGLPKLSVILQTVLDQKFSEDISKKVSSSIRTKTELGEFLPAAGSIPYGFLRDAVNVTYKVDEEVASVVLKIYTMRSEQASISAITNYLNEQGIPSRANYGTCAV